MASNLVLSSEHVARWKASLKQMIDDCAVSTRACEIADELATNKNMTVRSREFTIYRDDTTFTLIMEQTWRDTNDASHITNRETIDDENIMLCRIALAAERDIFISSVEQSVARMNARNN